MFPGDNDKDGAIRSAKPPEDIIKVSFDAATFSEHGAFGIGMIARNSTGELVHAQTWRVWNSRTADFAEAMAIKEALSRCKTHGDQRFEIESDCLVVIKAICHIYIL